MGQKRNPTSNKYKKPTLTHNELMSVLSLNARVSVKTVKKVYQALVEYIIEDLKCNGKTRLQWLGVFYADIVDGGVKKVPCPEGGMIERYCSPRRRAYFIPAESFAENLNEDLGVNSLKQARQVYKRGQVITAQSPLKIEREQAVKNLIEKEALKVKYGIQDDDIEIDPEDLSLDAVYDEDMEE